MTETIYIQIASYRDPQLVPTILDCLQHADNPRSIRIVVAWQYSPGEDISALRNLENVEIIEIPYQESLGACWARSKLQSRYKDETYTLCLDSHHRFVPGWDTICKDMIKTLHDRGHKKPLLTSYVPSFSPTNDPQDRNKFPWKMNFDRFIPEGAIFFLPASIDNFKELTSPIPGRFLSAHFIFTLGKWNVEVPYDPNYYFHGEEINLAVRSYTHGYDLFHPHKIVAWHEYTREGRTKVWDDDKDWHIKNAASHRRNRVLFGMDSEKQDIDFGIYGFGTTRSLADYERYAGICFKKRAIQDYTLKHGLPPNPQSFETVEDWEKSLLSIFKHCIDVQHSQVPETDYQFWCVAFHDTAGNELYRRDADAAEIKRIKSDPAYCKIWREFQTPIKPAKWVVWPFSYSKKWCEKIEGYL